MKFSSIAKVMVAAVMAASMSVAVHAADLKGNIIIKGSDTMVYLGQAWAEAFMKKYPKTNVSVTGGGSGTGIAALINGTTDICQASRDMKEKEVDAATKKGRPPVRTVVGLDGISVIVSPKNPVKELTLADLAQIFTGTASNWKDFGGKDQRIIILSREVSSGTHVYFKEHVLKNKNYASTALLMPSNQAIVDEVAQNEAAVGYVGVAYGENPKVKMVGVKKDDASDAIFPTDSNVKTGKYAISRPLYVFTGSKKNVVKEYIDFLLSAEGQAVVKKIGFVSVK